MTRYELSDGKSHKFWAASVDGEELTTNWGRIGTDGQSKTKSLGSPEAADKELAKLIRAKTKKGYVLVGQSAAPAKPAAAKPAAEKSPTVTVEKPAASASAKPAAAKPAASASADLPDESVANVAGFKKHMPVTRGSVKPMKFVTLEAAWRRFCGRAQKLSTPARLAQDKAFDGLGSALDGLLDGELIPFPEDPDAAGLLMARLAGVTTYSHSADALLDVALAHGGAAYALETILAAMSWKGIRSVAKLERGDRGFDRLIAPPVIRLRSIACGATNEDYEAMLASAKRFKPLFFGQRAARAVIFPSEPGFLAEVVGEMKTVAAGLPKAQNDKERGEQARLKEAVKSAAHVLLWDVTQVEEVALVTRFARCTPTEMLAPLRRLGAKMTPMVMQCATDFEARAWVDKEAEQELAKLLVATPSDEPVQWLIAHMDRPSFAQALSTAAKAYPVRVLTLLGPVATGRGKAADIAQSLVSQILGLYPSALEVAKTAWDENTRVKVQKLMEDSATAPPADVSSLPKIFTDPRWTQKRPKAVKHKAIELAVLEHPRVFQWPEGARERWLLKAGTEYDWGSFWGLANASEQDGAKLIRDWRVKDYYAADGWEKKVVARYGQDSYHVVQALMAADQAVAVRCALPFGDVAFAEPVADAYARLKSARKEARAWLLNHPELALIGLIPAVVSSKKKAADSARRAIALLVGAGHGELLLEVAGRYGDEAKTRAEELSKLDALDDLPKKIPALPSWCAGVVSPELKAGGSLPKEALGVLLTMLAISKPGDPYAGVELAVDFLTTKSLARTSWSLFEAWRLGGMDSKQGWAFHQLGLLGDDECARKLTPILRKWPGEGGHARATQGLEILAEIGSDVALMNLYAMSQKLKFKGLKKKAAEKVQEIADARGMSKLELADRLVPNFDLDRAGSMTLDFGPRRFEVAFDEQLKPVIRDEAGKIRKSLPKVGAKDDAEKATEASARFKRLKKDVKAVAQMQITRLENVMCEGRTWTHDDFQSFLVDHPLLIHVVRRLIWGVLDGDEVKATFRVAEDNTFADADDESITLPDGRVGLMHVLQLSEMVAGKWGDFLSDYEVLQPFDQIARTTYALTPAELKSKSIDRVEGHIVPTSDVMKLTKLGWQRGDPQDGGCICWMQRETSAGYFILPLDPGMIVGMPMEFPEQTLGKVQLEKSAWGNSSLPLTNATATQLSEVIRSLDPLQK